MGGKCKVCKTGCLLVLIGALNWGLVGAIDFNLVEALLGPWPMVVRVVYILVGLCAVMGFLCMAGKGCKCCKGSCGTSGSAAPGGGM